VELVDEEDDAALGLFHLVQHGLQPFLELAPVLGPGDEGAHVQVEDGLVLQGAGHVPFDDALGQPLGDGGLAHAGLADEHGVVFGFAGEDADDVPNLLVPADDRVQLILSGRLHQVGAVLLEGVVGLLRVVGGHPLVPPHGGEGLQNPLVGDVVGLVELGQLPVGGLDEGQQKMLHRDVLVLHLPGGLLGGVQGPVYALGDIDFPHLPPRAGDLGELLHLGLHGGSEAGHGEAHAGQKLGHQAVFGGEQGQQEVALLNLLVAVFGGEGLGGLDGLQGLLGVVLSVHANNSFPGKYLYLNLV